jgi:tRNA(Ile)-lysidine synthase TilS/MesJ
VNYGNSGQEQNPFQQQQYSEQTAITIDDEVHELIDEMFQRTVSILEKNRELLNEMAEFLKKNEVLEGDELEEMLTRAKPLESRRAEDGTLSPPVSEGQTSSIEVEDGDDESEDSTESDSSDTTDEDASSPEEDESNR